MSRLIRSLALTLALISALRLVAAEKLVVGATPVPAGEILEFIKPTLAAQGVELEIRIFTDYLQPNAQLAERRLDANFYQHRPFLAEFNRRTGAGLVALTPVLIAPLGGYSAKWKSLADLPHGATILIPNDPTNGARALVLLSGAGLVELKNPTDPLATPRDIVVNLKHLRIRELEAATIPRVLNQADLAVINTNYALEARLDPKRDALLLEDQNSPYVNVLVARPDNQESAALTRLAAALTSTEVRTFIETKYRGAILPAF